MCCPAPWNDSSTPRSTGRLRHSSPGSTPTTRAYSEIWLDGDLAASNQPERPDTLYGEQYLPRKFKTAIAIEGDNCVDPPPRGGGSTQLSPSSAIAVLNLRGR